MQNKSHLKKLQRCLAILGLYMAPIDGIWGNQSKAAMDDFMINEGITSGEERLLFTKVTTFDPGPLETRAQLAAAVRRLCTQMYVTDIRYPAYIMATIQWETGNTYMPIEEGSLTSSYAAGQRYRESRRYAPHWGRGYVQLTHDYNYKKYGKLLGIDLVNNPHLAKDKYLSLFITVHGMLTGSFTGKKMSQYVRENSFDEINIRRVVNGIPKGQTMPDKADVIAGYYKIWRKIYEAAI